MKKWFTLLLTACMCCALLLTASAETLSGTLVRSGTADPWLFTDGEKYYLTQTGTSRIAVFASDTLDGLKTPTIDENIAYTSYYDGVVYDPTVIELFGEDAAINGTWSPEIHYISEEDFGAEYAGWYMFVALRKNTGDSSVVRMVVLKSTTDSPNGPYGHPISGTANCSQPLLQEDGSIYDVWGCGQSILRIAEGPYKGIYATWVAEEGRGNSDNDGTFHQKLMIAKLSNPFTLASDPAIITTPTQDWEYAGASSTYPRVVEGGTAVYGTNGEVFLTYSGSGYWSDYGLGQLTWTGGDPLLTSSWVKLPDTASEDGALTNPIFTATTADDLRGAGHASFITDKDGNGFFCYHAYPYADGTKASARSAYIESYYIDYTAWNGTSYGVIRLGSGVAANTSTTIDFATDGDALGQATVTAEPGKDITLTMEADNATGYMIYRSTDGTTFAYLASTDGDTYVDDTVTGGKTYYYRVYSTRAEEIGAPSDVVSAVHDKRTLLDVLRILRYVNGDNKAVVFSKDDVDGDGDVDLRDALTTLYDYVLNN
ncbi:MAG: family 43 glycosylhydrolase [Clostridia bacterium]|nr:family 43 glycosylhydrolase [Clostridia bacterium]